jgi:four helix bundle protein
LVKTKSFTELTVYQKASRLASDIFELSKNFPAEGGYSITDQMCRSSRFVTSCIADAWARRRYKKAFVNKLTESLDVENETEVWLDCSFDCEYILREHYEKLIKEYGEVRSVLKSMISNPEEWCS